MITVTSKAMTGSEVTYDIPPGTRRIYFQAPAANVTMATTVAGTAGATVWTLTATEVYLNGFDVNKGTQTLYFKGTNEQILIILLES